MRQDLSAFAVVLVLLFVGAAGRAEAGKFEFKAARVSVEVPKGWKIQDATDMVTFVSKDQMLVINMAAGQGVDVDAAWSVLIGEVGKLVDGFSAEKNPGVLGGLTGGYVGAGSGTMGGASVSALVAAFPVPGGAVTVFVVGVNGKYEKHEKAMAKFLDSILPVSVLVEDDQFAAVPKDGQKFAVKLAATISNNDSKGFLKLVGKKGFFDGGQEMQFKTSQIKGHLKELGGKVSTFVGMPASGDFRILWDAETGDSFQIYRGEQTSVVSYVTVKKEKKKWVVTGSYMQDHGAE